MESRRWWHVAVLGTAGVLATLLLLTAQAPWQLATGFASIAVLIAAWFSLGRVARPGNAAAVALLAVLITTAAVSTAIAPVTATIQFLTFPLAWLLSPTVRRAIIANVVLALAVGLGLFLGAGADAAALVQAALIQTVSFAFSLAMGLWITNISHRSLERQTLLDQLQSAHSKLTAVSREAGVSSERERLAREIHDTIAQELTGLVLVAQRARRELDTGDASATAEQLEILEDGARRALAETRALVAASAPVGLDSSGISGALERLGARFTRETGITVAVTADAPTLERDIEVVLLRCAQEGLANVRKHSQATSVKLGLGAAGGLVALTLGDDGVGFDPELSPAGFGLSGMRERLALVDGRLSVDSGAGGTTLVITLPLEVRA